LVIFFCNIDFQNYFHCLRSSAALFEVNLTLSDFDLSIIQEAIGTTRTHLGLHKYLDESIAYMCEMMDDHQREWLGFGRWYADLMEAAVFGSADEPILVED